MAVFYQEKKKQKTAWSFEVECTELDLHGRGVAKAEGRTWFIPDLMPGEKARVQPAGGCSRDSTGTAVVLKRTLSSPQRRAPDCPHLGRCGGCSLYHLPPTQALEAKINAVRRLFNKNCRLNLAEPEFVTAGTETAYRRACRFAVHQSHGRVELGFRGRGSHELAAVDNCPVLTARINACLPPLTTLINQLQSRKQLGHVEFIDSDGCLGIYLRFTTELPPADRDLLAAFGREKGCLITAAEPHIEPLFKTESLVESCLTDNAADFFLDLQGVKVHFQPSAFVQINKQVNDALLWRVVQAVQPAASMQILDLFCGLGNFSFVLARSGAQVCGVDIVKSMIAAARDNAAASGLPNLEFVAADLEAPFEQQPWAQRHYDAVVLDPGRQGAKRAAQFLSALKPELIAMISCNPQAASRDVMQLLQHGYVLKSWGALDMFPRTEHLELMLVFAKQETS